MVWLKQLLKPFYEITILAQKKSVATLQFVPRWIDHIQMSLARLSTSAEETVILREMADYANQRCSARFNMFTSSANLSLCAAALTPYTCGLQFTFMNDSLKKAVWNKMERDAIELLTDDASETSTASSNQISGPALYSSESSDESAETIQAICVRKALANLRKHWSNNHQTYIMKMNMPIQFDGGQQIHSLNRAR